MDVSTNINVSPALAYIASTIIDANTMIYKHKHHISKPVKKHEKYNSSIYKERIKDRDIQAKRILLLLEYRCTGKVGLRQGVKGLFKELGLLTTTEELGVKEAALDYLKGLGFIDLAEESKYRHAEEQGEHLKQKTYGITIEDDIVLTFNGVKECEIMHKRWFFRYTDRTIQHMDSFSTHTGLWMVLATISILGYFVSL